ncbi:MAG TPA: hypothetical protein VLW50_20450 [Streptosporangiaceae bacterium]|nr:hypothetical protein [Streptosporangiaceae bacterium]
MTSRHGRRWRKPGLLEACLPADPGGAGLARSAWRCGCARSERIVDVTYPLHRYFAWGAQYAQILGGEQARLDILGDRLADRATPPPAPARYEGHVCSSTSPSSNANSATSCGVPTSGLLLSGQAPDD